ncbi:hypothetical protein LPJ66_003240 [Kickxella alabastrina]|uniref:Uncharacterized protein n=1 Tax=Kickxella alabastrina TaxID=61397 RepID=A0ACC1INA8_9FUNG|nr:hypothetical protein LPJ66_003240 [Kickxella alabastrina]
MTCSEFKSIFPDVDVPLQDLPTFFFEQTSKLQSDRPIFVNADNSQTETLTGTQLHDMSVALASGLYHTLNVRKGDVVAVVLPNTIYYFVVTMAALMLGATCTLINPAYVPGELAQQLGHCGAKFVVTDNNTLPSIRQALAQLEGTIISSTKSILCVDRASAHAGVHSIFGILSHHEFPRFRVSCKAEMQATPAFLCYSGGTTGLPKGVMLSHYNIVANILQGKCLQDTLRIAKRTTLTMLPIFHIYGLVSIALTFPLCGSSIVFMSKFNPCRFLQLIEEYKVTDVALVPPIINTLAKLPPASFINNVSSLQLVISGAAPLGPGTTALFEVFINARVAQGYGLTETSPGISFNIHDSNNHKSSGTLMPNIEAIVVDDYGRRLGPGKTGELCSRGPNIMLGYLQNEEETTRVIGEDGFSHTGDIGFIDHPATVFVTDRKKELIKFNGFQVAPAELEGILLLHPQVKDCAVIGVFDDERLTEVPRAFLVLSADEAGRSLQADEVARELVEWVNGQVAYFKHLRGGYVLVDAIPKSPAGKIPRRVLRDMVTGAKQINNAY